MLRSLLAGNHIHVTKYNCFHFYLNNVYLSHLRWSYLVTVMCSLIFLHVAKDCKWGDWVPEGQCSKTCGSGTQTFSRKKITLEAYGGQCSGNAIKVEECNTRECKGIVVLCSLHCQPQKDFFLSVFYMNSKQIVHSLYYNHLSR